MTTFDPRALVRQFAAAVNAHDLERIAALCDEHGLIHDFSQKDLDPARFEPVVYQPGATWARGRAAVERYWQAWFTAVPDLRLVLYGLVVSPEGAALECTFQGAHQGDFLGIPPRGRRIGCQAAILFSFRHDKIHEQRLYYDLATLQRQMTGAKPGRSERP